MLRAPVRREPWVKVLSVRRLAPIVNEVGAHHGQGKEEEAEDGVSDEAVPFAPGGPSGL
jgi:hypothetical protein